MPCDDGEASDEPHRPRQGEHRCGGCRRRPFPFELAFAGFAYGGSLTQAIMRFKHGGYRHLARPLWRCLQPAIAGAMQVGVDVVCPVPLHPRRLRQRGYNQVLELLRLAKPSLRAAHAAIVPDALARIVDTPSLGHHSPCKRRELLAQAFVVRRPRQIAGKRVLLVDDVMTSGATLAEGTRALLSAGARSVVVAALARTL